MIISFSPIDVRSLNKTFYFLSSGYDKPGIMGPENLPLVFGRCEGNPSWQVSINFDKYDLASVPSAVWFRLAKQVYNMPINLITNLRGTQIEYFHRCSHKIGNDDCKHLKFQGTQIKYLDLSMNNIWIEGALELDYQNTQIESVNLSKNPIPHKAKQQIIVSNPHICFNFL